MVFDHLGVFEDLRAVSIKLVDQRQVKRTVRKQRKEVF